MDGSRDNPHPAFDGLDERALLAYVEGELTAGQQQQVLASLEARPEIRARLDAMRRDRAALASMADEPAPSGLLAGVADALEREALLAEPRTGGAGSDDLSAAAEAPTTRRDGVLRRLTPLALAAGAALALGAGLWLGLPRQTTPDASGTGPLAMNEGRESLPGPGPSDQPATETPEGDRPPAAALALDERPESESVGEELADASSSAEPAARPAGEAPSMGEEIHAAAPEPLDATRAAELAREGRLVMRVRVTRTDELFDWLTRVDAGSAKVALRPPEADLVQTVAAWRRELDARTSEPAPTIFASRPFEPVDVSALSPEVAAELRPGVLLMEMEASERALRAAASAFERQSGVLQVVLEAVDEPLARPAAGPAGEVIWWRQAPREWTPRATVPVLIEPSQ